jgi:predicted nucleotidyltransferase
MRLFKLFAHRPVQHFNLKSGDPMGVTSWDNFDHLTLKNSLLFSTGSLEIDHILVQVITRFATSFPGRLRACYLAGSYAEGHAIPVSDVDLFIVFKERFRTGEEAVVRRLEKQCVRESLIHLELAVGDEVELQEMNRLPLKLSSQLLFGEDIRERIPLPAMDDYIRSTATKPWRYSAVILRGKERLALPLDYPDPRDEFFGYMHKIDGSKWLVALVGAIVTARLAGEARQYVPSRMHCARLYREYIHDGWTELVCQVLERFKGEWHYLIPSDILERSQLSSICQSVLNFENHYYLSSSEFLFPQRRI